MSWDQVKRLQLETDGILSDAYIQDELKRMKKHHQQLVKMGKLDKLPDWEKSRPWGLLEFPDDEPFKMVRVVFSRSECKESACKKCGGSKCNNLPIGYIPHEAHFHNGGKCLISGKGVIQIQDNDIDSVPVLIARFKKHYLRRTACNVESTENVKIIYETITKVFGKGKYQRKLQA